VRAIIRSLITLAAGLAASSACAQDKGPLDPKPLPPLANPSDPKLPAKEVFGRKMTPASGPARSIGFYSRGCVAGAVALPLDGASWQVMRPSRDRNWGNPAIIAFLERASAKAKARGAWNGILVGDIGQPRGGPMLTGHASHQVGLDADVWLTQMPNQTLSRSEREEMSAVNIVTEDGLSVDPSVWTEGQAGIIQAAAEDPATDRIFVNAAIKKALCATHHGEPWMTKVRAYWGHNYHFHIRIKCPAGETTCKPQDPAPLGDGCDKSLDWWFTPEALHPKPGKPRPPVTMAQMPPECRKIAAEK